MNKIVMFILFILVWLIFYTFSGVNLISSEEAKRHRFTHVIDVRTRMEYNAGHYPGAINIPVNSINSETTKNLQNGEILVYCNTGQRARFASEKLKELGFNKVYYIAGTYKSLNP